VVLKTGVVPGLSAEIDHVSGRHLAIADQFFVLHIEASILLHARTVIHSRRRETNEERTKKTFNGMTSAA
jgi:hypothetical protein